MKLIPRCIQTVVMATANKAHFELVNHSIPSTPNTSRILFKTPKDGWNKNKNMVAPAATETPIVDAKIVLKNPIRSEERRVGKERRHTRSKRDWSSDVCSSDLHPNGGHGHSE